MAGKTVLDTVVENISGLFVKKRKRVRKRARRSYRSYSRKAYRRTNKRA